MRVLVTGAAGFIGSALCLRLLERGDEVMGVDSHNDYYDPALKEARLTRQIHYLNYTHLRADISDARAMDAVFTEFRPQRVVNLAAQAGVRYSIENPSSYISSNIVGFANILECCRHHAVGHLVYASSSSVYGANTLMPFSVRHPVGHPLSLYAATKRSNELMAHAYSNLYGFSTTGLRFFTVYGPWGRPDMALFKFTVDIIEKRKIQVFNFGKHRRDFTYIDDIVSGIVLVLDNPALPNAAWSGLKPDQGSSPVPWRVFNIGNNKPIELMEYISAVEKALGMRADIDFKPMQPGDVPDTHADVDDLVESFGYQPGTPIEVGVGNFVDWYIDYHGVGGFSGENARS